ncbi:MAG: hypothetical protein LUQ31_06480 [Methanoregula sp.]|nr:hypothetical protein [Methanoregula sp.]
MNSIRGYEIFLGAILVAALCICGYEVLTYSAGSFYSREPVCIGPQIPGPGLAGYWDYLRQKTGVGAGTSRLTGLKVNILPDGTIHSIDIRFFARNNGTGRQYLFTYRENPGSCGWSDGFSSAEELGMSTVTLPADPGQVLYDLGKTRFADIDLPDRNISVETDELRDPVYSRDAGTLHEILVLNDGSVKLLTPGTDPGPLLPLDLIVSRPNCTEMQNGNVQCRLVPDTRLLFAKTGTSNVMASS